MHDFYSERIGKLQARVNKLHSLLSEEDYKQHESTKLLARIYHATQSTIPDNPNNPDYFLKGNLSKFRRFKRGIKRYRLIFCFTNNPAIILYLYINDNDHLRKEGDKNDPYKEFEALLSADVFSHDPLDPKMKKWIKEA